MRKPVGGDGPTSRSRGDAARSSPPGSSVPATPSLSVCVSRSVGGADGPPGRAAGAPDTVQRPTPGARPAVHVASDVTVFTQGGIFGASVTYMRDNKRLS